MLWRKIVLVKIVEKKVRTCSGGDFLRKDELKKIVLNRFRSWIWVMNYWFVTEWLRTLERGGRINSISLWQMLGFSI